MSTTHQTGGRSAGAGAGRRSRGWVLPVGLVGLGLLVACSGEATVSGRGGGDERQPYAGSQIKGYHEGIDSQVTYGWACNPSDYSQPVEIHFYRDNADNAFRYFIGATVTDEWREEAVGAECGGHRARGFRWTIPASLKNGAHAIYAYAIDPGGSNRLLPSPQVATWRAGTDAFKLYGWYYRDHSASSNDLPALRAYGNVAVAIDEQQAKRAVASGYQQIIFRFSEYHVLQRMADDQTDFWTAYRAYLDQWKATLIQAGVYNKITLYKIGDEPALHPQIYPDQAFLDQYVAEFKARFVGKQATMAFAGNTQHPLDRVRPPAALDILLMDPYFWGDSVPCDDEAIRSFLYSQHPNSPIDWATQFNKPIIVAGDAMLRGAVAPKTCYVSGTFNALKDDPRVVGLVWFVYDRSFSEGVLSGAANDPAFVEVVRRVSLPPTSPVPPPQDPPPQDPPPQDPPPQDPPPNGSSCAGHCGGKAQSCYCDAACVGFGDCCPDYAAVCGAAQDPPPQGPPPQGPPPQDPPPQDPPPQDPPPNGSSCAGHCGGKAQSCYCDAACSTYGDCCADYAAVCGAAQNPPPQAPPPSGPGTGPVIGYLDGVNGANQLAGWACFVGAAQAIAAHVYVGAPAGSPGATFIGAVTPTADSSEQAIHDLCQTPATIKHRFLFALDAHHAAHAGKPVFVHGIVPPSSTGTNDLISNSGNVAVP